MLFPNPCHSDQDDGLALPIHRRVEESAFACRESAACKAGRTSAPHSRSLDYVDPFVNECISFARDDSTLLVQSLLS
jgi:hypothetical protein